MNIDQYVQGMHPAIMAPHLGDLPGLTTAGHRYIIAKDGVYVEFRRPWAYGVARVAKAEAPLPFGEVEPKLALKCGRIPSDLMSRFKELALRASPLEIAAWIVWHEDLPKADAWELIELLPIEQSAAHIRYERPVLPRGAHLVLDLHSHGVHPAVFSKEDDRDDAQASEVKLAGVVGNLKSTPQVAIRLCAAGVLSEIPGDW